jgi:RNA polymerase sigma-70 factor (ECF subfamily)
MDDKRARFEGQVLPHLDAAYRFARWLCSSPGDADDVLQEAVLRAFRGFEGLRGSDAKSWLLTIVRNCHLTTLRQTQRRAAMPLPEENEQDAAALIEPAASPEDTTIQLDQKKMLHKLIGALPEEQRTVLMLREIEEMDYAQIAAVTQVPIGTVMSRLARSRAALKAQWLQAAEGEPRAVR